MNDSLVILGRQPMLGLAELESLCGGALVELAGNQAAIVHAPAEIIPLKRLGGSVKLGRLLTTLDTTNWKRIESYLSKALPEQAKDVREGKLHIGISSYGVDINERQLLAMGLTIKKAIQRATAKSVRLVPNKTAELNTAQVLHHKLTGDTGWEILLVTSGAKTLIAQTTAVQDIDAYAERDFNRPNRDAKVGMLPPKLAQIIVNLATASATPMHGGVLLDPFCGTGVVLQEATLMGFDIYGSDIDPRMVEYTDKNLMWLLGKPNMPVRYSPEQPLPPADKPDWRYFHLEQGDATTHQWSPAPSFVACETYLGRPFTSMPSPEILAQTITDCNLIIKKFLHNIQPQLSPGTRLCLAVPAWQIRPKEFRHLPLVDQITDLGYNQVRFERVRDTDLLYYRPDQFVARQLLVLTTK